MLSNDNSHPYVLDSILGCWRRPDYTSIDYSDGTETEDNIAALVQSCQDRSVLSDELRALCTDWPTTYHLSGTRANILRPFEPFLPGARVLEIGAGCGAITRFLGESGSQVLALEGSLRRAGIARARTSELDNVTVLAESFSQFEAPGLFDCITLIGVLEYANLFVEGEHPTLRMLNKAASLLAPDGMLIIAIENQLGLKYFAGAPEDHLWKTLYGVEGRYRNNEPKTFGANELCGLLSCSGLGHVQRLAPFPDYKFPYAIITEAGARHPHFDAGTLAAQHTRKDQQLPAELVFAPERVWPEVHRNGLLMDLSNSFLFAASRSPLPGLEPGLLAFNYSTDRKAAFCKRAAFRAQGDTGIVVEHARLSSQPADAGAGLTWLLADDAINEPYIGGRPVQSLIVDLWKSDGWTRNDIAPLLRRHLSAVLQAAGRPQDLAQVSLDTPLPGRLIDLTLSNLMSSRSGEISFDQEWRLEHDIPLGWLLFRSYLILMQSVTRIGRYADRDALSRSGLMKLLFDAVGLPIVDAELQRFADQEADLQSLVMPRPIHRPLNWYADAPLNHHNTLELLWYERQATANVDYSLAQRSARLAHTEGTIIQLQNELAPLRALKPRLSELEEFMRVNAELESQMSALVMQYRQLPRPVGTMARLRRLLPRRFRPQEKLWQSEIDELSASPAFDEQHYLASNPDLPFKTRAEAARHFHLLGWRENRRPAPWFDCESYLLANPDVLASDQDPFLHFLRNGISEKRKLRHTTRNQGTRHQDDPVHEVGPVYPDPYLPASGKGRAVRASMRIFVARAESSHYEQCRLIQQACNALGVSVSLSLPEAGDAVEAPADLRQAAGATARSGNDSRWLDFLEAHSRHAHDYDVLASISTQTPGDDSESDAGGALSADELTTRLRQSLHLTAEHCSLLRTGLPLTPWFDPASHGIPADAMHDIYVRTVDAPGAVSVSADLQLGSAFFVSGPLLRHFLLHRGDLVHFARQRSAESLTLFLTTARSRDFSSAYLAEPDVQQRSVWYEEQQDFSSASDARGPRALAFYLPQFRPTPENDAWHGTGFTEWFKVRSAFPLFEGHYQQHIPHPDLGYYTLEDSRTLRQQAAMLKQAGMHGMIFYHYWFTGRLILEKAAQMLLAETDIDLPFCFCWANENWTKRWDGEDQEVLLAQTYSRDDAQAFIEYLIPFFKDPRYIRVHDRPVVIIYRPSAIEQPHDYLAVWAEQCQLHGLPAPYVVATLTRGAVSPQAYGMDAALERPLNDWTDGAVPDIRPELDSFTQLQGSVLDYTRVADHYSQRTGSTDFVHWRSVVPVWDNTPRYKSAAYLLNDFSNVRFQHWTEATLADTRDRLPPEEQVIVVNAWNEWAEGAHLEPDERHGYAYLNAMGRALSVQPFFPIHPDREQPFLLRIHPEVASRMTEDSWAPRLLAHGLQINAPSSGYGVATDDLVTARALAAIGLTSRSVDNAPHIVTLHLDKIVAIPEDSLSFLATYARRFSGYRVVANHKNDEFLTSDRHQRCLSVPADYQPGLWGSVEGATTLGTKVAAPAWCYRFEAADPGAAGAIRPQVSALVRYHSEGSSAELQNAVYSLLAHTRTGVEAVLLAQDLQPEQLARLDEWVRSLSLTGSPHRIRFRLFSSTAEQRDMRCEMLNCGVAEASHPYVSFLDYDDTLFPGALTHLSQRLNSTGAKATFGRVYHADLDDETGLVQERRINHGYGSTYDDFIRDNCAPIHSFMLDRRRLDLDAIRYFPDMKFMEDYYFLLQVLDKEHTDWASLVHPVMLGDYNFRVSGRHHTLVFRTESDRKKILENPHYQLCNHRINELRCQIAKDKLIRLHNLPNQGVSICQA